MKAWWAKVKRGVYLTFASIGILIGAIIATQPPTLPPPIPVVQTSARHWVLTNDYSTVISNWTFTIKAGFSTDFASIPVQAHGLLGLSNASPCLMRGALSHDAAFSLMDKDGLGGPVDLQTANALLRVAILADGCSTAKADAVWAMVDAWSIFAVDRHDADSIRRAREYVSCTPAK